MNDASRKRGTSAATVAGNASVRGDSASPATAGKAEDVVLVHSQTEGGAYRVLRKRGDQLHVGEMRPLEEGKALTPGGEVVALRPRPDSPQLYDAQTLYRVPGEAPASSSPAEVTTPALPSGEPGTVGGGPAQVATPAYRDGFRAIFGGTRRRGSPPNSLN